MAPSAVADEGPLRDLFLQAPLRLQQHVERMLALSRSKAGGIWTPFGPVSS